MNIIENECAGIMIYACACCDKNFDKYEKIIHHCISKKHIRKHIKSKLSKYFKNDKDIKKYVDEHDELRLMSDEERLKYVILHH